jgi:hypothetical protein
MKFQPKTEAEFAAMMILPEGEYPFQVTGAEDATSKTSGREMIVLDLVLFGPDGANRKVKDYLVPGTGYGDKKIFEFCRTTGLAAKYDLGSFSAADCIEKTGYAKIGVEPEKDNGAGGTYPPKNTVKWYIAKPKGAGPIPTGGKVVSLPSPAKPTDLLGKQIDDGSDVPF